MHYNIKESMGHLLAVSHWKLHQQLAKIFKESGLEVTPDQWFVLASLLNAGPLYQSQIAYTVLKDRAGVKRLIDQLENKELVTRKDSENDARTNIIDLTEKGKLVVVLLNELAQKNINTYFGNFNDNEVEQTKDLLKRFIQQFEGK